MKTIVAALTLLLPTFASAALRSDKLVFSEILPVATGGDRGQFIELYNPTFDDVDLAGYKICNYALDMCSDLVGMFPASTYYTLCLDISQYAFCNIGTDLDMTQVGGLADGDYLLLIDPESNVVDFVAWTNPTVGMSYVRGLESNLLDFTWTNSSTPGVGFLGAVVVTPMPTTSAPITPTPAPVDTPPAPITPLPTPMPVTAAPTTASPVAPSATAAPITPQPTDLCAVAFCHPRADCNIVNDKAICTCKSGFAGDGQFICNDIDGK